MGSSCFSRGNRKNAEVIKQFIASHNLEASVRIEGCLCQGKCKNGPNIKINGKIFSNVTPESLETILSQELKV
jgi:NADH:ubiquinone oxidoreductase subunit E